MAAPSKNGVVAVSAFTTIAYFTILLSVGFGIGIARFAMDNPKCLQSISSSEAFMYLIPPETAATTGA